MQGILFTPDNHKAIRDKLKTQTRRLDHLKELNQEPSSWNFCGNAVRIIPPVKVGDSLFQHADGHCISVRPRYQVGETVYIKEAWAAFLRLDFIGDKTGFRVQYKLDNAVEDKYCTVEQAERLKVRRGTAWDSPMYMPAWAARDFIKILDVRPERLQDIITEDAVAEGIVLKALTTQGGKLLMSLVISTLYAMLWDSIYKAYPFDSNPWVWRYRFLYASGMQKEGHEIGKG